MFKLMDKEIIAILRNYADNKIMQIELSDLLVFVYDLTDTQGGLKCWRMGYIFCGKHPLLLPRIQLSDPGPMDPLVKSL